jgi:phenylacetic acid degradation operon negative regulatory protein
MLHSMFAVSKTRDTTTTTTTTTTTRGLTPLNARSLALSLLLGSHPPELPASALVAFGELFDVAGGTMRTALSRMVTHGDVTADAGRYRLAGELRARQSAQDAGRRGPGDGWDGRWHSVVAAPDQRDVAERRRFRTTMANLRFGELRPDIWMRPANLGSPTAGDDWIVLTGAIAGVAGDALVRRLWDLDEIAATAGRLRTELADLRVELDWSATASIAPIFTLSAEVVRFLRGEPLLPIELAPDSWPVDALRTDYDQVEGDFQRLLRGFLRSV